MTAPSPFWQPRRLGRPGLLVVAALSALAVFVVETQRIEVRPPDHALKLRAARRAEEALTVVRRARLARTKRPIDVETDPTGSGLVGLLMSEVTSNSGRLAAKQLSLDPNFAAIVVALLGRAGVERGDVVAVGFTGSFPALNVSVMAALEVVGAHPLTISSNAASQWGANDPDFLWVDWERTLVDERVFGFRSAAMTIGGIEDRGLGMSAEGIATIARAIDAARVPRLPIESYADSVERRMALYRELAGSRPIKAYVNVGGGTSSVGTRVGKHTFKPGLNTRPPLVGAGIDSVMSRFADDGVPVLHLVNLERLARRYGLERASKGPPVVGQGKVFAREVYDPRLAALGLAAIGVALALLVRAERARAAAEAGSLGPPI
jgi:poly-gamma-glutamate system protein